MISDLVGGLLVIATASVIGLSIWYNRDLLSPVKVYLGFLVLTFGEVYIKRQSVEIYLIFVSLLLLGAVAIVWERILGNGSFGHTTATRYMPRRYANVVIWAATGVAVAAQVRMIAELGGIAPYLVSVGLRTSEWAGLGPLRTLALTLPVINALYAVRFTARPSRPRQRLLFYLHVLLTVLVSLLSGSRNTLVGWFVVLVAIYNYAYRRLSVARAGAVLAVMLAAIVVIGAARGAYRWTGTGVEVRVEGRQWAQGYVLNYGLYPVQVVLQHEQPRLYGGATLLTVVTNFVPRKLWPDKPPTGGVLFTRDYLYDFWKGQSYHSTGVLTEVAINFGKLALPLGLLVLGVALHCAMRIQARAVRRDPLAAGLWAAVYAMSLPVTIGILYLEITNAWMMTATRLLPFYALHLAMFKRA